MGKFPTSTIWDSSFPVTPKVFMSRILSTTVMAIELIYCHLLIRVNALICALKKSLLVQYPFEWLAILTPGKEAEKICSKIVPEKSHRLYLKWGLSSLEYYYSNSLSENSYL